MPGSSAFASLHLEGAPAVKAKLVVGSDGGNSKVRQLAQLRTVSWSYKQRGLVATVATATPNTAALQVFLPNGPLALLPVRDGFSNIVWSTTPAQAAELEAMTPENFVTAVNMVSTAFLSSKSKSSPCLQSAFFMLPNLDNWRHSSLCHCHHLMWLESDLLHDTAVLNDSLASVPFHAHGKILTSSDSCFSSVETEWSKPAA